MQALDTSDYFRRGQFVLREARFFGNGVVHELGLLHPARDFQKPQQPCLAKRKPSLLHLLTATNNVLRSTFGRALCMTFWLGLTYYPNGSVHRFTGYFLEEKLPEMLEEIPLAFKEKHMIPARWDCHSICTSGLTSHRHLQRSLNWTGRVCGLASQVSEPNTNELLTMRPHWTLDLHVASWFWRDSYCPYWWGSGNHHAATWHFWMHTSNSAALLSAVCRGRWPHVWISALNW